MAKLLFDIETLGFPLESFDEVQQEYLMRFAATEEEKEESKRKLNLSALTAQIITIGMMNPETSAGQVLFQSPEKEEFASADGSIEFRSGDERDLLERFWETVTHYDQFITFNGRSFDCPFLMLRSAMIGVKPSRNILPSRYSQVHIDLLDQFTFYGATRKFSLDFYCKSFGIKSPKSGGITGLDLGKLHRAGKHREIAEYCLRDLRATAELYRTWNAYLNFG
ncbi:MAG: ribonuclease H-like domain-containing protein [Bacteroidota bacterium]